MRTLLVIPLFLFLTACAPLQTHTPVSPVSLPPVVEPSRAPGLTTSTEQPPDNAPVSLQITSPLDQAIVNTSQVDVAGLAPAGTVVTINDQILVVGPSGQFTVTVPLDEGPNLIEVVASDAQGNEVTTELTVTYQP